MVDATGRGSRTPVWLAELGYQPPEQERVEIGLGYATRTYRLRPGAMGSDQLILTAGTPAKPRAGFLSAIEEGRHILTIAGICGDHPPTDPQGFDDFVARLPSADIAAAIAGADPLDDPVPFRFPASVRHRYERLAGFPAACWSSATPFCSFNPVYGQGMTVAAMEAMTLRGLQGRRAVPDARRYFRAITTAIDAAWDIAVAADLAFPQVPGRRSAKVRLVNAYLPRLHAAAAHDQALAASVVRVIGLKDRPEGLLRPDRVLRVLRGNLANRGRPSPAPGEPGTGRDPSRAPDAVCAVTGKAPAMTPEILLCAVRIKAILIQRCAPNGGAARVPVTPIPQSVMPSMFTGRSTAEAVDKLDAAERDRPARPAPSRPGAIRLPGPPCSAGCAPGAPSARCGQSRS